MRYGILADIHANLHALEAVLDVMRECAPDRFVVAGDLVGYGAFPNECVELVAGLDAVCVAGNHDLIALGRLSPARCIPLARESLEWTSAVLDPGPRRFLDALRPIAAVGDGVVVAHGTIEDPQTYTVRVQDAEAQLDRLAEVADDATVLVLGHTHHACFVGRSSGRHAIVSGRALHYRGGERHLLNPGSVGQSRERRPDARFAMVDTDDRAVTFHTVPYDVVACRRALERVGLPTRSHHLRPSALRRSARVLRGAMQRASGA